MSDWEIRTINNQLERLDEKVRNVEKGVHKENTKYFVWLVVLSTVLFWRLIFSIDFKQDFKVFWSDHGLNSVQKNTINNVSNSLWEIVPMPDLSADIMRMRVPHGWIVMYKNSARSIVYVPDEKHEWKF